MKLTNIISFGVVALIGWSASALAEVGDFPCQDDARKVGRLVSRGDRPATVKLERADSDTLTVTLPACVQYDDVYMILSGEVLENIKNDNEVSRPEGRQSETRHRFPPLPGTQLSSKQLFASIVDLFARGAPMTVHLASRSAQDAACAPETSEPLPIVPLQRLPSSTQKIGTDLNQLFLMWQTAEQPRHVYAALTGPDGRVVQRAATCRDAYLSIPIPQRVRVPGGRLAIHLTDEQGGKLDFVLELVDPAELPEPTMALTEPWQVATWRLAEGPIETRLDSIGRLALAAETSLDAQQVLGAVAADLPP